MACPERLCSLHCWRFLGPGWSLSKLIWLQRLCFEQKVGLETSWDLFQPEWSSNFYCSAQISGLGERHPGTINVQPPWSQTSCLGVEEDLLYTLGFFPCCVFEEIRVWVSLHWGKKYCSLGAALQGAPTPLQHNRSYKTTTKLYIPRLLKAVWVLIAFLYPPLIHFLL